MMEMMEFLYVVTPSEGTKYSTLIYKGKRYLHVKHQIQVTKCVFSVNGTIIKPSIPLAVGNKSVKIGSEWHPVSIDVGMNIILGGYKTINVKCTQNLWITRIFDYDPKVTVVKFEFDYQYTDHIVHKYSQVLQVPKILNAVNLPMNKMATDMKNITPMDNVGSVLQKIGKSTEDFTENEIKGILESLFN